MWIVYVLVAAFGLMLGVLLYAITTTAKREDQQARRSHKLIDPFTEITITRF